MARLASQLRAALGSLGAGLLQAAVVRAQPGLAAKATLAKLLLRACYGFALQRNAKETERLSSEVWALSQEPIAEPAQQRALSCQSMALAAWAKLLGWHPADAVSYAQQALGEEQTEAPASEVAGVSTRSGPKGRRSGFTIWPSKWFTPGVQRALDGERCAGSHARVRGGLSSLATL